MNAVLKLTTALGLRNTKQAVVVIGVVWYLTWLGVGIDCRRAGGGSTACWGQNPLTIQVRISDLERLLTALGGLGVGGWLGYNTYNPSLRDPRLPDERH